MWNKIKQWFKNATKTRSSRLAFIASIFSLSLLISVTAAWFVVTKEVPQGTITTGFLDAVATVYDEQGNTKFQLKNLETTPAGEVVFSSDKLFELNDASANTGGTVYISIEIDKDENFKPSLDLDYNLIFRLNNEEMKGHEEKLGAFYAKVTTINNNDLNYSLAKYQGGTGVIDYPTPWDPKKIIYDNVLKDYISKPNFKPYTPCTLDCTDCPEETKCTKDNHNCTEFNKDDPSNKILEFTSLDRYSKFGTLTTSEDVNTSRTMIRIDYGVHKNALSEWYTNAHLAVYGELKLSQVGSQGNDEGIKTTHTVYNQQTMIDALNNSVPGDRIVLTKSFTYTGDLNIIKAVDLVTNGNDLTIDGNLIYDYTSKHNLKIDLTSGGSIRINRTTNNAGGNFLINAPTSDVSIVGMGYLSKIYVDGDVTFNATNATTINGINGTYGMRLSGVDVVGKDGFLNKNVSIGSNTNFILDSDAKISDLLAENDATNIQVYNYGSIRHIDFSNMKLIDEKLNDPYDTDYSQITIRNFNKIVDTIKLPAWSVPFKVSEDQGVKSYTGNTRIIREVNSSKIVLDPNSPNFTEADVEDSNKMNVYVVENNPHNDYTVYYHTPENIREEDYSIKVALSNYFTEHENELKNYDSWIAGIKKLQIITLENKFVTNADIDFLNDLPNLTSLDLQSAILIHNTLKTNAFNHAANLEELILPDTIKYVNIGALSGTKLDRITLPKSVISADVSNYNSQSENIMKFITIEGSDPKILENVSNIKNGFLFVNDPFIRDFKTQLKDFEYRVYPKGIICDDDIHVVRPLPNGKYELIVYTGSEEHINVGDNLQIDNNPILIGQLGEYAYTNATNYFEVTSFSESLTSIGRLSFYNSKVYNIKSFSKIDTIDMFAFRNCISLVGEKTGEGLVTGKLSLGDVKYIKEGAFDNCVNLFEVNMPNIIEIGQSGFSNCRNLSFVNFERLEKCETNAFAHTSMYYVTFDKFSPNALDFTGLSEIKNAKVFVDEINYEKLLTMLPDSPVFIKGVSAGNELKIEKSLVYCGKPNHIASKNVGEYIVRPFFNSLENYEIITCNIAHINSNYTVPSTLDLSDASKTVNIVRISDYAFYHTIFGASNNLIEVTFSDNNNTVGKRSFVSTIDYKKYIKNIKLNKIQVIEEGAFANIDTLETLDYYGDPSLDNKNIVHTINEHAFSNCSSLVVVHFPELLRLKGEKAYTFANCTNLVQIYLGNKFEGFYGQDIFYNCDKLRQIFIDNLNAVYIDENLFRNSLLPNLKIYMNKFDPKSYKENIARYLHEYGQNIGTYNIEVTQNGVIKQINIGEYTVDPNKTTLYLNGELSISSYNVDIKDFPVDYTIPETLTVAGTALPVKRVGFNCYTRFDFSKLNTLNSALENMAFPNNLIEIGERAFASTDIRFKDMNNIQHVEKHGFTYTDLYFVDAPQLVAIDEGAFAYLSELIKFNAPNLQSAGKNAFDGDNKLRFIYSDLKKVDTQLYAGNLPELREITFDITGGTKLGTSEYNRIVKNKDIIYFTKEANLPNYEKILNKTCVYRFDDPNIGYADIKPIDVVDKNTQGIIYTYDMPSFVVRANKSKNTINSVDILKNFTYDIVAPVDQSSGEQLPYTVPSTLTISIDGVNQGLHKVRKIGPYSYRSSRFNGVNLRIEGIDTVGFNAFGNTDIGTLVELNTVTELEGETFAETPIVEVVAKVLTKTGADEFRNCTKLNQVRFTKLTALHKIFTGCVSLTFVQFESEVELLEDSDRNIEQETFIDSPNVKILFSFDIEIPPGEPYHDQDGYLVIKETSKLPKTGGWKNVAPVTIMVSRFNYTYLYEKNKVFGKTKNITLEPYGYIDTKTNPGATIFYEIQSNTFFGSDQVYITNIVASTSIKKLNIPNTLPVKINGRTRNYRVTSFGSQAFKGCPLIEEINLPNNFTFYDDFTFIDLVSLKTITVSSGNKNFSALDGVLFNKDKTVLYYCPSNKPVDYHNGGWFGESYYGYDVPDSVKTIASYAFAFTKNIERVNFNEGIQVIGSHTFTDSAITECWFKTQTPPTITSSTIFSEAKKPIVVWVPLYIFDDSALTNYRGHPAFSNTEVRGKLF